VVSVFNTNRVCKSNLTHEQHDGWNERKKSCSSCHAKTPEYTKFVKNRLFFLRRGPDIETWP
jgi:hypothetical protein